jgi:Family of unknown function (DUF5519)
VIFAFVVTKLRWLARVPLFPQIFDTMLLLGAVLRDRRVLCIRELLEDRASDSLGVGLTNHRFGGVGFVFDGAELGHLHGNGLFDAFVGTDRDRVVRDGLASPHHLFARSSWVSVWIKTDKDVTSALELLRIAKLRLNRNRPGSRRR